MVNLGVGGGTTITSIEWMIGDDDGVRYIFSTKNKLVGMAHLFKPFRTTFRIPSLLANST